MSEKEHYIFEGNSGHKPVKNSTENGACLIGHNYKFANKKQGKDSCNYRYQSYEQAKSNADIKKYLHSYNEVLEDINDRYGETVPTSSYIKAGTTDVQCPGRYCTEIPVPKKGDWDIDGPSEAMKRTTNRGKKVTIKKNMNFSQDTWPYWNNAHHLIPKGALKKLIMNQDSQVGMLLERGLLEAKYNINHKRNMLFMPMDKEVGAILDMPRHIQGKKDQDDPSISSNCTSHPVYDRMVREIRGGLEKIVDGYVDCIDEAGPDACAAPDFKLDKSKLEKLSDKLLKLILDSEGGRSLDSIANSEELQ